MRKRRRGRLFQRNKETISVTFRNIRYDPYAPEGPMNEKMTTVASDIECVWHPNVAPVEYQDSCADSGCGLGNRSESAEFRDKGYAHRQPIGRRRV